MDSKKRLGRGLDALLGAYATDPAESSEAGGSGDEPSRMVVSLALIHPNPRNPRRTFDRDDLEDLARSLGTHGLVQPIVVRRRPDGEGFEIIAGERRWRAAQKAGLHDVPVVILDVSDRQALELAIVENVQRSDLNPVEEARGYQALIDEFDYSQADLGDAIGRSRVHVTNTLRLLKLPGPVLDMLERGELSAGHGRALLGAKDCEALAAEVRARQLSVRETERRAQEGPTKPRTPRETPAKDPDVRDLEADLGSILGVKVDLRHRAQGNGEIRLSYRSLEQLDLICTKLRR